MKRTVRWISVVAFLLVLSGLTTGGFAQVPQKLGEIDPTLTEAEKELIRASGIKSRTVLSYQGAHGSVLAQGNKVSYTRFDRTGNIVEMTIFDRDGAPVRSLTQTYDPDGFPLESLVRRLGEVGEFKTVYHYDLDRNIDESVSYMADGTVFVRTSYRYDGNGRLIEASPSLPDLPEAYSQHYKIEYNSDGMPVKTVSFDSKGNIRSEVYTDYDEEGTHPTDVTTVVDGLVASVTTNRYDSDGNLMVAEVSNADAIVLTRTAFKYDGNGRVSETLVESPTIKMKSRVTFEYDTRGNLIGENQYNKYDELVGRKEYIHEYYEPMEGGEER